VEFPIAHLLQKINLFQSNPLELNFQFILVVVKLGIL
jgi:hypothetical protein